MKYLKLFSFLLMLILLGSSCGSGGNESDNNQKEGISKSEMTKPQKDKFQNHSDMNIVGLSDQKMSEVLTAIAEKMESEKLEYDIDLGQDASGIFHKIKDQLQLQIPSLGDDQKYIYPEFNRDRITRQIADWYHHNGNLTLIENAMDSKNLIRPGAVMFFGKSDEAYKNINIDLLTDKKNNYSNEGAIAHMAVVTAVKKDDNGNVIEYTMMQGRRPGRVASRSSSKAIQSPNTKGLPPFGNWKQQWVAMANIITEKK